MIDNYEERFKTIDIPQVDYLIYKEHPIQNIQFF